MEFEAVIFDLDGTLLDTIDDITDALNALLLREGYNTITVEQGKALVGYGGRQLVRCAFMGQPMDDDELERRVKIYRKEYEKRLDNKTRLYDGIAEMLDIISSSGIKMAVLSNKNDRFTQAIAKKYFSRWHFERFIGEKPDTPTKPDPASALEITRVLGVNCDKVAFIGDSETDMRTANAAGMPAIGVLWGFRTRAQLESSGGCVFAEKPSDILKILEVE